MAKKIIAYHTVVWSTVAKFNDTVNKKIDEGYVPYGNLIINPSVAISDPDSKDLYESGSMYIQAMVMYSDFIDNDA